MEFNLSSHNDILALQRDAAADHALCPVWELRQGCARGRAPLRCCPPRVPGTVLFWLVPP